jgi:hypothetical protein
MTLPETTPQPKLPLVLMQSNPDVDSSLTAKTLQYLHTGGLPISDELGFDFTGQMVLLANGVVRLVSSQKGREVCLDLQQNEIIRWEDEVEQGFINSSAEQFTQSVQAFEHYLEHVQAKEIFGPFYDNSGSTENRAAYANALADKLRAIDPAVFERGYYWPAFIEEIENGL